MLRNKKKENFLDLVPVKNKKIKWIEDNGAVQIHIDRNSCLDKVVRFFLKTPKVMKIDLDNFGSFVWRVIDGQNNMESIGVQMKHKFGDDAEPLYERLITYINVLKNNNFISIR